MAAVSILAGKEVKKEQLWATAAMNALVLEELRRLEQCDSRRGQLVIINLFLF
jgi:hypothetical protein